MGGATWASKKLLCGALGLQGPSTNGGQLGPPKLRFWGSNLGPILGDLGGAWTPKSDFFETQLGGVPGDHGRFSWIHVGFSSAGHPKSIFSLPRPPKRKVFFPQSTKNQYFLSPEHQKSILSVPEAPKINIFCPWNTKNEYFLSLEHQKSIFSVPGAPKINIFCPWNTKKSIFSVSGAPPSAVAGTQLCCALDIFEEPRK